MNMTPQTSEGQPQGFTPYGDVPKPGDSESNVNGVTAFTPQGEAPTTGGVNEQASVPAFIPQVVQSDDEYSRPGWSWGAFMFNFFFIIAIRKYSYLWLYLLFLVPIVNLVAWIGIPIFLGVKGRELAATSKTFTSRDQYVGFMKGEDHAGKVLFFIILGIFAVWIALASVFFFSFSSPGSFMERMW